MKKEILIVFIILVLFSACTKQSNFISSENMSESEEVISNNTGVQNNISVQFVDPDFNIPADQNTPGWVQTSGPLGGVVIRMIENNGKIWASLYSGGIYELQKANFWKQIAIGHGIPENRAFDIVVDPSNTNIAYVPEMIACLGKTIDGGFSWQGLCDKVLKNLEAPNFNSHTLALDPDDQKILYVPGHIHDQTSMLLVSKNRGENWEKLFTFDRHYDFNHLIFYNSKMYLSTRENGIFVSSDKGKSWVSLNEGLTDLTTARFAIFKDRLYLVGGRLQYNVRMGGSLYRLSAQGLSWEKVSGLEQVTGLGSDGVTLFVGTWSPKPQLWTSTDGINFQSKESLGLPQNDWVGEIVSLDSKIYVGAGGNGIYVSSDGGNNFEEFNKGLASVATREVYVNPDNENEIYVGTWDRLGLYWSKNAGKSYKRLATDYNILTFKPDPQDFSHLYGGGDRFFEAFISESGSEFIEKTKPGSPGAFIKVISIDPNNSKHLLAGMASEVAETPPGEGLWESFDQGDSWTRAGGIGNFAVYSILFNPIDSDIVYASALGEGVFKSIDGGSHFTMIGGNPLKYTYRLAMSQTDPNMLIASSHLFFAQLSDEDQYSGNYGGIFQSNDGGDTWKEITAGIRNYEGGDTPEDFKGWLYNFGHMPNYEMILIDPKDPNHLIVGHHGENVVITLDGGKTWEKVEQMVPGNIHNYAYCLGASSSFDKIYACTCGRGLFKASINNDNKLTGMFTASLGKEDTNDTQPRNAEEAKSILLSGEYNHEH